MVRYRWAMYATLINSTLIQKVLYCPFDMKTILERLEQGYYGFCEDPEGDYPDRRELLYAYVVHGSENTVHLIKFSIFNDDGDFVLDLFAYPVDESLLANLTKYVPDCVYVRQINTNKLSFNYAAQHFREHPVYLPDSTPHFIA